MSIAPPASAPPATTAIPQTRLVSLDAMRGTIMLFMASAGFGIPQVAKQFPDSGLWSFLSFHTSHATWVGGGAWDMIQPAFMFMVGVAMPWSYARRIAAGHSFARNAGHALWRSFVLVALAVFLASNSTKTTNFIFTNVLGQIGLGYTFLFLLLNRGWKVQLGAMATIAVGTWTMFAMHGVPPASFDFASVGVKADELKDAVLPGFFAHWDKNTNAAAAFDQWFLNLFPHDEKSVLNAGGYTTLNFVPSLITMILGLMTGEMLRRDGTHGRRLAWMFGAGALCVGIGLAAGWTVCPIIKRIWTPSWALYSGGIVLGLLAVYYAIVEMCGCRRIVFPLVVIGMNSIAIYLMAQLLPGWITGTLKTHLGRNVFEGDYGIVWQRCTVLAVLWLVCWWMYRRKIFLRI
jgi:predicted acyltransferase